MHEFKVGNRVVAKIPLGVKIQQGAEGKVIGLEAGRWISIMYGRNYLRADHYEIELVSCPQDMDLLTIQQKRELEERSND